MHKILLFLGFTFWSLSVSAQTAIEKINELVRSSLLVIEARPDSAFKLAKIGYDLAEEINNKASMGRFASIIGKAFFINGAFTQSLSYHLEAARFFEEVHLRNELAESYNSLGLVSYASQQSSKALEYHNEALALFTSIDNKSSIANTLGFIGHIYEKQQQYDLALSFQNKALSFLEGQKNLAGMALIFENIGSVYEDLKKYKAALVEFKKALNYNLLAGEVQQSISNYNNIGDIYRKSGLLDSGLYYTLIAKDLAYKHSNRSQIQSAFRDLSKVYFEKGQSILAFYYMDSAYNFYEDLYKEESAHQAAQLQTFYSIEKKNKAIEILEKDQKIERLYRYTIVICSILIGILLLFLYNRRVLRFNQEKQLVNQQNDLIKVQLNNAELNAQRLETEIENKQLKEQQLQLELEQKSRSLTSQTLHMIQKNKLMEELKLKLKGALNLESKEKSRTISELIHLIDFSFNLDKDWDDFKVIFEQLHQSFFENLKKVAPELSPAEIKLCSLLKLNINSKDMAPILGISIDSLRISRYRLRKKLKIAESESLTAFIMSL
jgi:tetratricopeptide (TPR) repeat protein